MSIASVVVATCNRPRELDACLSSLTGQSLAPARIVVVDDAPGGDDTAAVVAAHAGHVPVVYVEGSRAGLSAAHNRGVAETETPIVAFTDDDVVARKQWLERVVAGFFSGEGVACVTGRIIPFELESRAQFLLDAFANFEKGETKRIYDLGSNRPAEPLFPFAAGQLGSGANMAFTRSFLDEMGGFDPALGAGTMAKGGDDLAAFFEVIQSGHRLVYEPSAVIEHRHAREYAALRGQAYGYGVGLTAFLAKSVLDRPSLLPRMLGRLPRALGHILGPGSPKRERLPYDFPRELSRLERLGMMAGPVAYLASKRAVSRG